MPGLANPLLLATGGLTAFTKQGRSFAKENWFLLTVVGSSAIALYLLYRRFTRSNAFDVRQDRSKPASSISDFEAQQKADALYNAMKGLGTNQNTIYSVLNGMNYNDFAKISAAFGEKYFDKFLKVEGGWLFNNRYGLYEWLVFSLSDSQLRELQRIMPNVITTDTPIREGLTIQANRQNTPIYSVSQSNGVWQKGDFREFKHAGDEVGTVQHILEHPNREGKFVIARRPWSFGRVKVDKSLVEVM